MENYRNRSGSVAIHFPWNAGLQSEAVRDLFDCINRYAGETTSANDVKPLFVPNKNGLQRIRPEAVVYLEAERNYCTIHFVKGGSLLVSVPLSNMSVHFLKNGFMRIHRSYIINIECLNCICGNTVILNNGVELPVGKDYRREMFKSFEIEGTKSAKVRP